MDTCAIVKKTTSVQELITRFDKRFHEKQLAAEPTCDNFENLLPCFSHMSRISNCLSAERNEKTDKIMRIINDLQNNTNKCDGVSLSSINICKSLIYIVDSSSTVVHLLNRVTRNGSIPLSREHHEDFLQIINNCLQIAIDKANWNACTSTVKWPVISSLLKHSINMYKQTAEFLDSGIQEHHLLQVSTTKMLEQTSKLLH